MKERLKNMGHALFCLHAKTETMTLCKYFLAMVETTIIFLFNKEIMNLCMFFFFFFFFLVGSISKLSSADLLLHFCKLVSKRNVIFGRLISNRVYKNNLIK